MGAPQFSEHRHPYMGNFSIVSWNAAGLFCQDLDRYQRKLNYIVELVLKYDIVFIQETHDEVFDDGLARHDHLGSLVDHHARLYFSADSSRTGGILTIISHEFLDKFRQTQLVDIVRGRIRHVCLRGDRGDISFTNLHSDPHLVEISITLCR